MMTPIEKAQEAYNNSRDPMECAIWAFLDAILADEEAMWRICYEALDTSHEKAVAKAIEALKQEAER